MSESKNVPLIVYGVLESLNFNLSIRKRKNQNDGGRQVNMIICFCCTCRQREGMRCLWPLLLGYSHLYHSVKPVFKRSVSLFNLV